MRIIITLLLLAGCSTLRKTDSKSSTDHTCESRGGAPLSHPFDLGDKTAVDCVEIKRNIRTNSHSVQISLFSTKDSVWPRYFFSWLGKIPPNPGTKYPAEPKAGTMQGFYGISNTTITPPGEIKGSDFESIELTLTEIAKESNETTRGILHLTRSGKTTLVDFAASTKVVKE